MKILYNIILILFFINSIYGSCPTCYGKNEICTGNNLKTCRDGLVCGTPPSESKPFEKAQRICIEPSGLNGECFDDYNCGISLKCYKTNQDDVKGKCLDINFALVGESCNSTIDCYQGYLQTKVVECISNVCTNIASNCYANDGLCPKGQACSNTECVDQLEIGDSCTGTIKQCNPLLSFCDETSKECVKLFSLPENAVCFDTDQCDYTKNLVCDFGVCKVNKYIQPSIKGCNTNEECNADNKNATSYLNPETSVCNCYTGDCEQEVYSYQEAKATIDLYQCMAEAKCGMDIVEYSPSSCKRKNCAQQYCNTISLHKESDKCGVYSRYINEVCSSSSKLLPSLLLIVLTLIYFII